MVALILFGSFFLLLFLNIPIALSLGMSSIITLLYEKLPLSMVPSNMYSSTSKFVLLAIPFFIFGGNIMAEGGISERLINFCRSLVGHKRSGMALVCDRFLFLRSNFRIRSCNCSSTWHDHYPGYGSGRL